MKHRFYFSLLLLGVATTLSAQITVKGKIANMPTRSPQVALMDYWSVDRWRQLAILQLEDGGTFSASVSPPTQAQCRIRLAGQPKMMADFILPGPGMPSDSVIMFDLDANKMNNSPVKIQGFPENDLYYTLVSAYVDLENEKEASTDPNSEQIITATRNFNRFCAQMSQEHRGTFTGDIVANLLYEPQREDYPKDPEVAKMSDAEFQAKHALDKLPFYKESVLYHIIFAQKLYKYYDSFDPESTTNGVDYIEGIMSKRNGSDAVDLYLFRYLLDRMIDLKNEAGLNHLLKWYPPDCSADSPLPDYTKTLIEALKYCTPGNVVDDLSFTDINGAAVKLSDVCADNKLTLLLFWKTTCSHCREFEPVLAELYERYKSQGLEVIGVSIDKVEPIWRKFLETAPQPWISTFVPADQREMITSRFPIPSTPTLIALDKDRKVLSRLILREQLEEYLKEELYQD
ncbi:MAG: TlpA family protein disulfide reductase [Lewinellaceae bacterium]|nr:TlpA family protein disulfide reductase [Saprospiraceae bacterium]MCB9344769.1 TlpA family protein disulfide reductase [Lewinellaceae bacterium]